MKFSVVIPAKNEETDMPALLQSIRDQTLQPEEIVVADKSVDKTREIARSFGAIIVEGSDDGMIGRARNSGAALASGEIIFFLDADVILPVITFFEDALTCFSAQQLDVASCYYRPFHSNYKGAIVFAFMNLFKRIDSFIKNGFSSGGGLIMIKQEIFESAGRFREDLRISEDLEFVTRTVKKGNRYGVLPLWLDVSSRRFSEASVLSIIITVVGGAGTIAANLLGLKWFKERLQRFEDWYGETGGASNPPAVKDDER